MAKRTKRPVDVIGLIRPDPIWTPYSKLLRNNPDVVIVECKRSLFHPGWYLIGFYFSTEPPYPMSWASEDNPIYLIGRPRRMYV